eukprot:EG_transcript_22011
MQCWQHMAHTHTCMRTELHFFDMYCGLRFRTVRINALYTPRALWPTQPDPPLGGGSGPPRVTKLKKSLDRIPSSITKPLLAVFKNSFFLTLRLGAVLQSFLKLIPLRPPVSTFFFPVQQLRCGPSPGGSTERKVRASRAKSDWTGKKLFCTKRGIFLKKGVKNGQKWHFRVVFGSLPPNFGSKMSTQLDLGVWPVFGAPQNRPIPSVENNCSLLCICPKHWFDPHPGSPTNK